MNTIADEFGGLRGNNDADGLTQELLNKVARSIRRKKRNEKQPIIVKENGFLVRIDNNGERTKIKKLVHETTNPV